MMLVFIEILSKSVHIDECASKKKKDPESQSPEVFVRCRRTYVFNNEKEQK